MSGLTSNTAEVYPSSADSKVWVRVSGGERLWIPRRNLNSKMFRNTKCKSFWKLSIKTPRSCDRRLRLQRDCTDGLSAANRFTTKGTFCLRASAANARGSPLRSRRSHWKAATLCSRVLSKLSLLHQITNHASLRMRFQVTEGAPKTLKRLSRRKSPNANLTLKCATSGTSKLNTGSKNSKEPIRIARLPKRFLRIE